MTDELPPDELIALENVFLALSEFNPPDRMRLLILAMMKTFDEGIEWCKSSGPLDTDQDQDQRIEELSRTLGVLIGWVGEKDQGCP